MGKAVLSGQRMIDLQTWARASWGRVYAGICRGLVCLLSMLRASCLWQVLSNVLSLIFFFNSEKLYLKLASWTQFR